MTTLETDKANGVATITVCIDTNSINVIQRDPHINQLEEWHRSGLIEIRRTSALTEELSLNFGSLGEARRQKAAGYKEGRDNRAFTMRRSTLRGGDTLRGPKASQWVPLISKILFPGSPFHELSSHLQQDVAHLAIHKLHGWDFFVTYDRRHILRHQERLTREVGIAVLSPKDAVARLGGAM